MPHLRLPACPLPSNSNLRTLHTTRTPPRTIATTTPPNPASTLSSHNILADVPPLGTSISTMTPTSFTLTSGLTIHSSVLLLNNHPFAWRPSPSCSRETISFPADAWGLLDVVFPKPDLLIVGTGARSMMLHPECRRRIADMGIRVDVLGTGNAAAEYNLLAAERSGGQVAAALLVEGFWRGK